MLIIKILITFTAISLAVLYLSQASTKWKVGKSIRTPDSAFNNLPDYPFKANYIDSLGYQMHYLDEGPKDGEIILLLHGQPSWSYLYRHMIPLLSKAGYRVIAPDNVGFGKSDKPIEQSAHNYQMHVDVMSNFISLLNLQNITLFAQDWGGLIGLRVVEKKANIEIKGDVKKDSIKYETLESIKKIEGDSNGYLIIKDKTCYYVKKGNDIQYFNRWGVLIDENGNKLSKLNVPEKHKNVKPKKLSLAEQFKGMEAKGNQFLYESEKISEAKAIELLKENPKLNVSMHNSNGKGTVHLSKKGIKTVNGKLVQPKKAPKMAVNETKVTNLTVNADTLNELKAFDWKTLPSIFELNNPEEIITLSFNFDQKIKLGNSVVDSFNFTVSNKTSELHAMIKKSRKVISKLKAI